MVNQGPAGLQATHLPFIFDATRGAHGTLLGHMARANEQWRDLEAAQDVLVVFTGPHTYVSPTWYRTAPPHVPTWNYVAVHAHGRAKLMGDQDLRSVLS